MSIIPILAMVISSGMQNKRLVALEPNLEFPEKGKEVVKVFHDVAAGIPFREMISSWNVDHADSASLKVEVKAHFDGLTTKWYTMGQWTFDGKIGPRGSVNGQADSNGNVDTDTLTLKHDANSLDVQVTLTTLGDGPRAKLKLLTFAFANAKAEVITPSESSAAWGKTIDVPHENNQVTGLSRRKRQTTQHVERDRTNNRVAGVNPGL